MDSQGMFFVCALNTATYGSPSPSVVWGNAMFATRTSFGYLFQVDPAGTDHTITRNVSNTDTFNSASQSRARGGSAELSIPLSPLSGKVGGTGTNTTTGPTNSGSTQSGATDSYVVKVVSGITVKAVSAFSSIQSLNSPQNQRAFG